MGCRDCPDSPKRAETMYPADSERFCMFIAIKLESLSLINASSMIAHEGYDDYVSL